MLKKDIILTLNKSVLKRFEPNLEDGTVFLFNVENETFWSGNIAVDCFLRLIDGQSSLNEIYNNLLEIFEDYTEEEIINSYDSIVKTLIDKEFLVVKNVI